MSVMRNLYLFAAIAAVILAITAPYWLPTQWFSKKIRKQGTPSGGFNIESFATKKSGDADLDVLPFDSSNVKIFSKSELAQYNGEDKSKPLYLVVLGEVFDVTSGERFYAKGNGYNCFTGKDNSAAFHTGEFNQTQENVLDLPPAAVQGIVGWRSFFRKHETYKFVGVVPGLYFNEDGAPTDALARVHKSAVNAKDGEAEDARINKLFPRCNMHYDGIQKVSTVWCDGFREESDLKKVMKGDPELRVLRMVDYVSQATQQPVTDCRCLRPYADNKEAEIGSEPWRTAKVKAYMPEKGCVVDSPRCFMKVD